MHALLQKETLLENFKERHKGKLTLLSCSGQEHQERHKGKLTLLSCSGQEHCSVRPPPPGIAAHLQIYRKSRGS
eukprot:1161884-Pelagomonas_calceolata.AAC.4